MKKLKMKFRLVVILNLLLVTLNGLSQKDTTKAGILDQAMVTPKLIAARHEYNENNMRGSLLIYREILDTDPNNASALFGSSQCNYNLKKYKLALEYLDKAVAADPNVSSEIDFFYGQIYHRTELLDKAILSFEKFIFSERPGSYEYELAMEYKAQCQYAKEQMVQPVPVEISNLGNLINSRYDDYTPSITSDGKMIVFTSRRNDTKGGRMDEQGDYKYFEDIYFSELDEATGEWSQSSAVQGELNTETYDAVLSIFPNGNGMYVYKNTVNSTGDIYFSEYRASKGEWSAAEKMPRPINTSYFEASISMTDDGSTVYFISERPDGLGQGDIYVSTKKGDNWSNPKNLGAVINTDLDEKFVFIHPNGKTLYFSTNGHQTMGSYDIFKTEYVNGEWSVPINLGYPINTVNEESTFSLTKDNQTLMIAAEYQDSFGERDIYKIDVSKYDLVSSGYDMSTFGQLYITCKDAKGEGVKGAEIIVFSSSNSREITSAKADKLGMVKVNLPGNQKYKVEVRNSDFTESKEIDLRLKSEGETVVKLEFVIPE
jgi:tetratricopeptide (TPR) repeat protein